MPEKRVRLTVDLPGHEAEALARLVKRMSFDDVLKLAGGHPEAHDALAALLKLKRALAAQLGGADDAAREAYARRKSPFVERIAGLMLKHD